MIQSKNGETEFSGSFSEILADLSTVVCGIYRILEEETPLTDEHKKDFILKTVKLGFFIAEEEMKNERQNDVKAILKQMEKERLEDE